MQSCNSQTGKPEKHSTRALFLVNRSTIWLLLPTSQKDALVRTQQQEQCVSDLYALILTPLSGQDSLQTAASDLPFEQDLLGEGGFPKEAAQHIPDPL